MVTALLILGISIPALAVWLAVRIVNRRERWAQRTLAAAIGLPALYAASFGPACWITSFTSSWTSAVPVIYMPITLGLSEYQDDLSHIIRLYAKLGAQDGWTWEKHGDCWKNQFGIYEMHNGKWCWLKPMPHP